MLKKTFVNLVFLFSFKSLAFDEPKYIFDNNLFVPSLKRGPYLQMLAQNSIVIKWQTDIATDSKVSFGPSIDYGQSVANPSATLEHEIQLTGLQSNTKYFYKIGDATADFPADESFYFITGPKINPNSNFTVWVTGDFGVNNANQIAVKNSYLNFAKTQKADFWIWLGDNAYNSGTATEYTNNVFKIYPEILRNTPVFPAIGNHDYANTNTANNTLTLTNNYDYFNNFVVPTNGELGGVASTTEKFYSYNYGNAHFIVLDSYGSPNTKNSAMYNWLIADLQANTQKWNVCYFHHPPYSKGTHNSDTETELINMRSHIIPILERYNVDLVLSGHSHTYERSFLIKNHFGLENTFTPQMQVSNSMGNLEPFYEKSKVNGQGTVYAVCGISGQGGNTGTSAGYPHNAMAQSYNSLFGSLILNIKNDTLDVKLLNSSNTISDSFKIIKKDCVANGYFSSTNSGNWEDPTIWQKCGEQPNASSIITIYEGQIVQINNTAAQCQSVFLNGNLKFGTSTGQLQINNN